MSKTVRIGLLGYGGVGRAFWNTVRANRDDLSRRYGLDLEVGLVRRSTTQAVPDAGDTEPERWVTAEAVEDAVRRLRLDIIVQAVPGNIAESRDQIIRAMAAGADVVTATKSPLVAYWGELEREATATGRCIRVSSAAGAALPAVDLCRRGLRALPCRSVRASLNGTTNFVLNQLRGGISLRAAIDVAVEKGISEPNPVDDLSGRDNAMKIVILANLIWGRAHSLKDVSIQGVGEDIESRIEAATRAGRVLRSVAQAGSDPSPFVRVSLQELDPDDPLARLAGAEKGVEFDCGSCGSITVMGGHSSPQGAAFAMLKDVVNLSTGDRAPGFG
jgi:homoserine dehydrogenase